MVEVVSLYSGCGGFDLGFMLGGFEIIWAIDSDKTSAKTYEFNLGNNIINEDIWNVDINEIPDMDILIAGPPCQGFSTVGKMDPNDERNDLLKLVIKIVEIKKPKILLLENVPGLKVIKKGNILNNIIKELEEMNYIVEYGIINASDFGVCQSRKRLFIFANKIGINDFLSSFYKKYKTNINTSLYDTIGDIEKTHILPNHYYSNEWPKHYDIIISRISEGQKLCNTRLGERSIHTWDIPKVFGKVNKREKEILLAIAKNRRLTKYRKKESWHDASPLSFNEISLIMDGNLDFKELDTLIEKNYLVEKTKGFYDLKHTFNGKFRRLRYNELCESILTNYSSPRNYLHPTQDRPLTVRECARIQGFPDNFFFKGSLNNQYRMIGNAIPPPLAHLFSLHIRELLLNNDNLDKESNFNEFIPFSIREIILKLREYGTPRLGNFDDPIDELIFLIISQRTFEKSYINTYNKLKKHFSNLDELRTASVGEVNKILEPSGLGKQKAKAIHDILNKIHKDFGKLSFEKLYHMEDQERLEYLLTLPRVGIKTAMCLIMYCYNSKVLPIDANIRRFGNRIGFLPPLNNPLTEMKYVHTLIPLNMRYEVHVNTIVHGREVCIPEHPRCNICKINSYCDAYKFDNSEVIW